MILLDTVREDGKRKFDLSPALVKLLKDLNKTNQNVTVKHVNCASETETGKYTQQNYIE